jgi:hypothetical protein
MKRWTVLLVFIITFNSPHAAIADQVELEGFATFTYPTSVKLKKSGCQEIKVNYTTNEDLARENTVMIVAIIPLNSRRAYGYAAWMSTLTYMGESALPPMSRIGTLPIKVCRKKWLYSSKASRLTPAIYPGTFKIVFGGSTYDAVTGEMNQEKLEIYRKITFKK